MAVGDGRRRLALMQVLYLLPFILLSGLGGVVCLAYARWRPYVAAAFVFPLAFAVCAIVGLFATVLVVNHFGGADLFNQTLDRASWRRIVVLVILYAIPGVVGALIAASVANRLQRWTLRRLGFLN